MYRIVKLNMFFGSLLCTEDHIELNEIVEYFMTRGGSRPMQPMRMHRSEFHVNLITRSRVSIETPKDNKIHNLISKCMRVVPREALLWYYRSKQ